VTTTARLRGPLRSVVLLGAAIIVILGATAPAAGTAVSSVAAAAPAAAPTASDEGCEEALFNERICEALSSLPGVNWLYQKGGDVNRAFADAATEALLGFNPNTFIEEWARGMAEATVNIMAYIQQLGARVTTPAFDQQWWAGQYATSFGMSLILLAFLLLWITARIAATGSSVTGIDLLRQSGWRALFVVPLISVGPALLHQLQIAFTELAGGLATEGTEHAGGAVDALMMLLAEEAGAWGMFGGTVLALLLFGAILLLGVVAVIELAIAQWGLHMAALLIPLALVAWVYPPWSSALRKIVALLFGLLMLPAFMYFFFNTFWAASHHALGGGEDDGITLLLFILVGLLLINTFPLVTMWLMTLVVPQADAVPGNMKAEVQQASAGEMGAVLLEKTQMRNSTFGSGGADSGGAGTAAAAAATGGTAAAAGAAAGAASKDGDGDDAAAPGASGEDGSGGRSGADGSQDGESGTADGSGDPARPSADPETPPGSAPESSPASGSTGACRTRRSRRSSPTS
jgi:hypothetical protein